MKECSAHKVPVCMLCKSKKTTVYLLFNIFCLQSSPLSAEQHENIGIAAYYRWEQRGGIHGFDVEDLIKNHSREWLLYSKAKRKKMSFLKTVFSSIKIFFAGMWLVVRIVLEYFGIISDGNDRTTGIKDLREEYKKANYR